MAEVTLIYPYFRPSHDRSIFRYPPLSLGYIASYLREKGIAVEIVDCTFSSEEEALDRARRLSSPVIGIYSMYTMEENALRFARLLRENCDLLVVGGPLPSIRPEKFLQDFDVVVIGEGEETMLEVVESLGRREGLSSVPGIAFKGSLKSEDKGAEACGIDGEFVYNPPRRLIPDLDSIPLPARDLFENEAYKIYFKRIHGYTVTSIMTSRGCPFNCDFCSKPIFGDSYRARSPENVVDEIEDALSYGYERIFFQDDCFTLNERRVEKICDEILRREIQFGWECLSRVDSINPRIASKMKRAGCEWMFFGIESGNNSILRVMKKQFTVEQAHKAVELTAAAGIKAGAFFILGYPGETEKTILDTIRVATSLPLDYLSFTLPYPIPGTGIYEGVKDRLKSQNPPNSAGSPISLIDHTLNFQSSFSENKLKFAIVKAMIQFEARKHLGNRPYSLLGRPLEVLTDKIFKALK